MLWQGVNVLQKAMLAPSRWCRCKPQKKTAGDPFPKPKFTPSVILKDTSKVVLTDIIPCNSFTLNEPISHRRMYRFYELLQGLKHLCLSPMERARWLKGLWSHSFILEFAAKTQEIINKALLIRKCPTQMKHTRRRFCKDQLIQR